MCVWELLCVGIHADVCLLQEWSLLLITGRDPVISIRAITASLPFTFCNPSPFFSLENSCLLITCKSLYT